MIIIRCLSCAQNIHIGLRRQCIAAWKITNLMVGVIPWKVFFRFLYRGRTWRSGGLFFHIQLILSRLFILVRQTLTWASMWLAIYDLVTGCHFVANHYIFRTILTMTVFVRWTLNTGTSYSYACACIMVKLIYRAHIFLYIKKCDAIFFFLYM